MAFLVETFLSSAVLPNLKNGSKCPTFAKTLSKCELIESHNNVLVDLVRYFKTRCECGLLGDKYHACQKNLKELKTVRFELVQPFGQPQTILDTERCVADLQKKKQGDAKE